MQLATAGLLVIQNRKLLLAYSINKKCFYLPGGKIDAGEKSVQTAVRELTEETGYNAREMRYLTSIYLFIRVADHRINTC